MKPKSRKRKINNEDTGGAKSGKSSEEKSSRNNISKTGESQDWMIDYSSPKSVLSSMLKPYKLEDFFSDYWEKQPLVMKHANNVEKLPEFFSKDILFNILNENILNFVEDINVCRYVDGTRKNLNEKGRVTVKKTMDLLDRVGATLQIHQPQRFVSELWKLMEKLESFFNCLVGANVYITPQKSQGLSPHYDDVEVFIIQLEGEKEWKLYKPLVMLPREYSRDLSQEEIGESTHSFTLYPGDLLYMPRGTVHQAKTPDTYKGYSTHVTISTYQKHTVGDYLMTVLPTIVEKATSASVDFRRGLPVNNLSPFRVQNDIIKILLQQLPEVVVNFEELTSHAMLQDFMKFRLPPFGVDREEILDGTPPGKPPQLEDSISLAYPEHTTFILSEENDENGHSTYLLVYSSLTNDRSLHMMNEDDESEEISSTLRFSSHHVKAMEQLQNSSEPVLVSKLLLPSENEKLHFAMVLWTQHLINIANS